MLNPGDMVGRFRVEEPLGSGGMGDVYKAWDSTLERSVALKALRSGEEREAGSMERFRREALALAQLNHPHVCQVHDWVDGPNGAFIAMELVAGSTLDKIAPGLDLRQKLLVVRAVAQALEAAHAKGLVHRDLKPGNIMVSLPKGDHEPQVKVLDFGLARLMDPNASSEYSTPSAVPNLALLEALNRDSGNQSTAYLRSENGGKEPSGSHSWDRLTQAGTFMGSPSYASPEQIQGQAAGPASDVFSLGIVAWELLAGEHPYPGEGRARMNAIVQGTRRGLKVRGLSSSVGELLRGMLDPHPFRRPSAAHVAKSLKPGARGVWRWALLSAAGALLLAGILQWTLGRGAIADLVKDRPARLAVLPFENATGRPELDSLVQVLLPEMLEAGLRGQAKLAPIDAETLVKARTTLHLPARGILSGTDQQRLASAVGARLLLRGTLSRGEGELLTLRYELNDESGRVRHAGEASQSSKNATSYAIPTARKVVADLFKAVDPFGAQPRSLLPELPPDVIEAYAKGLELETSGDFKGAAPSYLSAAQKAPDFPMAVLGYARCNSRLAQAQAEPVYQWARWAARAQGNREYEFSALHRLASLHGDRGEWPAADAAITEALNLARSLGENTIYEGKVRNTMGVHFQRRNRSAEAKEEFLKALAMFTASHSPIDESRVLNNLAVLERERGDLQNAQARYLRALEISRRIGDRWSEAIYLNNLGDLDLSREGGLDRSEGFFQQALALREAIGDQAGLSYTLMGLASVAQARGDLGKAELLEVRFLDQARKSQLRPLEGIALYNFGELNRDGGRFEAARSFYRQALALHQELGDTSMEAHCLAGEAECLAREGRRSMARALFDRCRNLSTEDTPYTLRAQAWIARTEGKLDESRILFARALADARTKAPEIVRELTTASR